MKREAFGSLLRSIREASGKSMGALARHLEISGAFLSEVEQGRRAPLTREKILKTAAFLNTDPLPLIMAAFEWSGEFTLRVQHASKRAREVGASLAFRWESLNENDLEAIAKILTRREVAM